MPHALDPWIDGGDARRSARSARHLDAALTRP
jgi:hypothetical protein